MGKNGKTGNRLLLAWNRIQLVDKCLILFFGILLLQSFLSLFGGAPANAEAGNIDVIVRTSLASIFGYILSANFVRAPGEKKEQSGGEPQPGPEPVYTQSMESGEEGEDGEKAAARIQIMTAAAIGMICLAVLLVYRSIGAEGAAAGSATAAAAQLRDFVSGCVGFLIGSPGEKNHVE